MQGYAVHWRKTHRRPATFLPLEFEPGQDAQVDWGEAQALIAGVPQTVQVFVMRLNYSRRSFVMAFPAQKQEAFFEGHVRAFEHFGGVPHRLSYDNLATAVKILVEGRIREEQRAYTAFRSYYLFSSHFCTPGQGHEKGGVEHSVLCRHLTLCRAFVRTKNRCFGFTEGASEPCESGVSSSITSTISPLNS